MHQIHLSERTYQQLQKRANVERTTPDLIVDSLLQEQLATQNGYIELVDRYGGPQAVIAGTRIAVSDVIGYLQINETPESLVADVLPSLTLSQVYAALSYYYDHQAEIDDILAQNSETPARSYLREILGEEGYRRVTGQCIGEIPRTILLADRLFWHNIPWDNLNNLIAPALSIAALGAMESLLCGAVASKATGVRLHANQELIGQSNGNIVIPFFDGVPATAVIARTSVGIRSGGQTRMVSIIHSLALLASALLLAPVIGQMPLAALARVRMVTAIRMNEWPAIRIMFGRRFKTGMITFIVTLLATITLDLTQAILIGGVLSAAVFISQVANMKVETMQVDVDRLRSRGLAIQHNCPHVRVAYLNGPLFFASTNTFNEEFAS
jgi:uncharacterized protein (DUF433 family)